MEKESGSQLKTVLCGVALVALASIPSAQAQTNPCSESGGGSGINVCNRFDSTHLTNKYQFGDNFIKFTVENLINPFDLNVELESISQTELDARVIPPLAPVDCIPYSGATSDIALGDCVFYRVTNPPSSGDFSGDVTVRIFWDFPTLAVLNNVRLYRAPSDGVPDTTCTQGFDCYSEDITDAVFAVGDSGTGDPGVGGKSKGFSDFEAVDRTESGLTAKVKIGLKKSKGTGILFDLKAVVKRNGIEVSSGELLGAPTGGKKIEDANLLTIPVSFPTETFGPGDDISIKVLVRNSCLANPQSSGAARLWYDDNSMSQVTEAGVPTLYLVRGNDNEDEDCDHEKDRGELSASPGTQPKKKRDVKVLAPVPSCDGPYRSFGNWNGTVPY